MQEGWASTGPSAPMHFLRCPTPASSLETRVQREMVQVLYLCSSSLCLVLAVYSPQGSWFLMWFILGLQGISGITERHGMRTQNTQL